MNDIKIGFSGSRNITELTKEDKRAVEYADIVIHGGARGYDTLIHNYAKSLNKTIRVYRPADPSVKRDYYIRNQKIVNDSNFMQFHWDGISRGTKLTMDLWAKKEKAND